MSVTDALLADLVQGKAITKVEAARRLGTRFSGSAVIVTLDLLVRAGILSISPDNQVGFFAPHVKATIQDCQQKVRLPGPAWGV